MPRQREASRETAERLSVCGNRNDTGSGLISEKEIFPRSRSFYSFVREVIGVSPSENTGIRREGIDVTTLRTIVGSTCSFRKMEQCAERAAGMETIEGKSISRSFAENIPSDIPV